MSDHVKSQEIANEKKGWKGLAIAAVLSILFLGIFYMAMQNEPDYMPSKQIDQSNVEKHAGHGNSTQQHEGMQMTGAEMKNMHHEQKPAQ